MARPRKLRKVCDLPMNSLFAPIDSGRSVLETLSMTVEQYETIRLIDFEGLTQEECAESMDVARTTVQRIYIEARKILADFLVNGTKLNIEGGNYRLCQNRDDPYGCGMCRRRDQIRDLTFEEEKKVIVGIPVDHKTMDANISSNFGRADFFLLYDTENNKTTFIENVAMKAPGGAGIKAAQLIVDNNINALISPRLGENAFEVISEVNIEIYEANGTSIQENITAFKEGKLSPLNDIHKGLHGDGGQ